MSAFCFVHASHLDLDAPMRGIDGAPAALRCALRDASLDAWHALVELAVERHAAFVLIAGGIFGSDGSTLRARAALLDGVRRLHGCGISTLISLGPEDGDRTLADMCGLAGMAVIFNGGRFTPLPIENEGVRLATVHGISRAAVLPARQAFVRGAAGGVRVVLSPSAPPFGAADTSVRASFDYWAFGESHTAVRIDEAPWIVGSGTIQGRGFAPDELGAKGVFVVSARDDAITGIEFAELDRVRCVVLAADLPASGELASLRADLFGRMFDEAGSRERVTVVDVELREAPGQRPARDRWKRAAQLLAELRADAAVRMPHLWWNRIRFDAGPAARTTATASSGLARVVAERGEALAAPTLPRSTFLAARFEPLRRVWSAELDLSDAATLVREATALAVDAVENETSDAHR